MKPHLKESLRDDLYRAIEKVLDQHIESGTLSGMLIHDSLTTHVTDSAMNPIIMLGEYYEELKDDGYIKPLR